MEVKLFIPCFIDLLFPEAGWACVDLLERAGCIVRFDQRATCCGQPAFNSGYHTESAKIATHLLAILSEDNLPVVIPSGSCGSMIVNHFETLPISDLDRSRWENLRKRTFEFTQFWCEKLGNPKVLQSRSGKILLHRSCHGLRELKVSDYAEHILTGISGLTVVPTEDRSACCGFGGTFSIKYPEISVSMADAKLQQAVDKGVDAIVAGDVSCLMHMKTRAEQRKIDLGFLSIAEVMAGSGAIR